MARPQANGRGSARLDMIPGDGADGLTGMLVIESKTYEFTYNATQRVSFATLGQPTVQTITDLVSQLGRDQYRFTENEEGCRYWIYTFISDLEGADIVAAGSKGEAWNSLSRYWFHPPGSGSDARAVDEGTFL
ncbi:conserved hypothetical protein [Histoplasma capsulatum G186AR]|uniref:DUF7770 domain-containing protein n=1 Tax=Ajellomyces capsulatus (strain G186AR / H82 / ATCC MYA-2454 / RMSCC 2432) TaxID=447093 RepID=C0NDJ8_AJECG|nr:uncharacterized protein HCBG_01941 [Histoplasma capsulatum G186AR]EEH10296.1 conserved hypothetical protein [Histoplasma capsulatum G186AR]